MKGDETEVDASFLTGLRGENSEEDEEVRALAEEMEKQIDELKAIDARAAARKKRRDKVEELVKMRDVMAQQLAAKRALEIKEEEEVASLAASLKTPFPTRTAAVRTPAAVSVLAARAQPAHDPRNPFPTPYGVCPPVTQTPAVHFAPVGTVLPATKLSAADLRTLRNDLALMQKLVLKGVGFKGKLSATPTRELLDLEARIAQHFCHYQVKLDDPDPGVHECILHALGAFIAESGPAREMYQDSLDTWDTYADFVADLYVRFQKTDAEREVGRMWNSSKQGERPFMEWKAELDRLWWDKAGMMAVDRLEYLHKLQDNAHPTLIDKYADQFASLNEAELIHRYGIADAHRVAKRSSPGRRTGESDWGVAELPLGDDGIVRLPRDQYQKLRTKLRAELQQQPPNQKPPHLRPRRAHPPPLNPKLSLLDRSPGRVMKTSACVQGLVTSAGSRGIGNLSVRKCQRLR